MSEIELTLFINEADADPERLDELSVYMMQDLLELGVDSVERSTSEDLPEGAKGDQLVDLGALVLTAVPALIPGLFAYLQTWVSSRENQSVIIKTPSGLEVAFNPQKPLSEAELLSLVQKLTQTQADPIIENTAEQQKDLTDLFQLLTGSFNEEELRTLCFALGIDYDDLPGTGRAGKARELILYVNRHGRLPELLDIGARQRPDAAWQTITG